MKKLNEYFKGITLKEIKSYLKTGCEAQFIYSKFLDKIEVCYPQKGNYFEPKSSMQEITLFFVTDKNIKMKNIKDEFQIQMHIKLDIEIEG